MGYEESGIELLDNGKFAQGLVGSEGAFGPYEFDPVGFSKWTELMPWLREAELKHGRICMLAWLGLVVPDFVRVPGEMYSFEACPVTIDSHDQLNSAVGVNFQFCSGSPSLSCAARRRSLSGNRWKLLVTMASAISSCPRMRRVRSACAWPS